MKKQQIRISCWNIKSLSRTWNNSKDQRATSGVGIVLNKKYEQNIENKQYVADCISICTRNEQTWLNVNRLLQKPSESDKISQKKILLLDLNARTGNDGVKPKLQRKM